MAKLILTNEVVGLGVAGDVVDVKLGYARNYLIPQGLAVSWSQGGQKQVDQIKFARDAKALASQEEAQSLKDRLESAALVIEVKAGAAGRLLGLLQETIFLVRLRHPEYRGLTNARSELKVQSSPLDWLSALLRFTMAWLPSYLC
jgi:ribosomal protein L9